MKKNEENQRIDEDPEEELYEEELEEASFQDTLRKYAFMAVGALVVIAAIVLGAMAYMDSEAERRGEASTALARVTTLYYEAGDYEAALNGADKQVRGEKVIGLLKIADQYGDTESGKLAALYAGQAFLMQNNYQEAEKYFAQAASAEAIVTRVGAEAGKAACKVNAGQYEEAAGLYESASALARDTGNDEPYQLFAAMLYEKAGQNDNALRLYREIIAENQFTEYSGEAKSGIIRLGEALD